MKAPEKAPLKQLALLQLGVLIYSLSAVLSKLAAGNEAFSPLFFLYYAGSLALLALYALIWQQSLRRFSLHTAYTNRAFSIVWNLLFGVLLFRETLTPLRLAGAAAVIAGILLVVNGDE